MPVISLKTIIIICFNFSSTSEDFTDHILPLDGAKYLYLRGTSSLFCLVV